MELLPNTVRTWSPQVLGRACLFRISTARCPLLLLACPRNPHPLMGCAPCRLRCASITEGCENLLFQVLGRACLIRSNKHHPLMGSGPPSSGLQTPLPCWPCTWFPAGTEFSCSRSRRLRGWMVGLAAWAAGFHIWKIIGTLPIQTC